MPSTAAARAPVRDGAAEAPLLGPLLEEEGILRKEVLQKWLGPTDCAMLARACWKCGAAVADAATAAAAEVARAGGSAAAPLARLNVKDFVVSSRLLAWAKENGCPCGPLEPRVCAAAAAGGYLEVLKWAREHDCRWDEMSCANAAEGGHLETLQWARENGCEWDWQTTANAAKGGHLELLQWAGGVLITSTRPTLHPLLLLLLRAYVYAVPLKVSHAPIEVQCWF
jgi:hypothetical protein